jgi:hypothetical protein
MTTPEHADACRLRTRELLKIVDGIYAAEERLALQHMIREFEELAIEAGPRHSRAAAGLHLVSGDGSGGQSAAA